MTLIEELKSELPAFLAAIEANTSSSVGEKHEFHYRNAITLLTTGLPVEGMCRALDESFAQCDSEFAFVYDHVKECFRRDYVLSYYEYMELNRRFPRTR